MSVPNDPRNRRGGRVPRAVAVLAVVAALLLATGCRFGRERDEAGITFWTPHVTPDRIAQQEATARRFTERTGIEVTVVPMGAADQNQALVTGVASGDVPDVILLAPDQAATWSRQGLLDTGTAEQVVADLGRETFSARALDMVTLDGRLAAVPSDGWGQVLVYRTDLFEAAGLDPPESLDEVASAARRLRTDGRAGIVLGTRPGDPFSEQTLEALLLANGCRLVDRSGAIALAEPACVEGLRLYAEMAAASVRGDQDVETTRAAYLAGEAAMLFWGSHIFDELAGLAPDFPPTCPECRENPRFLAENSGVVTTLTGPDNDVGAQYGLTLNLGVPRGADAEAAGRFVRFLLGDGYVESLAVSPEGRVPLRTGTPESPGAFAEAWGRLPTGEDPRTRTPLAEVYGADTVAAIVSGAQGFRRWGYGTEDAVLAGALSAQNTLVADLGTLFATGDAHRYARGMATAAADVRADVG
ncbi:ABC transporter substrate-binding protein [Marinactinospora rubrisoli]|uniref:ABC transporter substrate-binding protein n=1 Tax=Marinactinospora rubrisoli TaxID=2715399 RepID=A0ABW2KI65_9ACTN